MAPTMFCVSIVNSIVNELEQKLTDSQLIEYIENAVYVNKQEMINSVIFIFGQLLIQRFVMRV